MLSAEDLALLAGCSTKTVEKLEVARRKVTPRVLRAICEALWVTPENLWFDDYPPQDAYEFRSARIERSVSS